MTAFYYPSADDNDSYHVIESPAGSLSKERPRSETKKIFVMVHKRVCGHGNFTKTEPVTGFKQMAKRGGGRICA